MFQSNAQNRLHVRIDGPGIIAGIDNADLKDTDQYTGNIREAWHGLSLVVIGNTQFAGDFKLTVTFPGAREGTLTIRTLEEKQ